MPPSRFSAELLRERALSPRVAEVALRVRAPEQFLWQPGQYVELFVDDAALGTPYSIASAARDTSGEFELAMSEDGGRELLSRIRASGRLFVSEARGAFVWKPESRSTLLVGIGTGVAPLRAMLQAALASVSSGPVTLLSGARSEADILWRDEFEALSARDARFRFEPCLSQPGPAWRGRRQRVQAELPAVLASLKEPQVYVCGNRPMVRECVELLTEVLAVPVLRVASEAH